MFPKLLFVAMNLPKPLRFLLVGGFSAFFGLAVLWVLVQGLEVNKNLAFFVQSVMSMELCFILSKYYTWQSFDSSWPVFRKELIMFNSVRWPAWGLEQFLNALFLWLGIDYRLSYVFINVGMTILNYISTEKFVFGLRRYKREDVIFK